MKRTERRQILGKDVDITQEPLERRVVPDGVEVVEIRATCDGKEHVHRVTIGASDAPLPDNYDATQWAADLEKATDFAAKMAESNARKAALIADHFRESER